MVLLHTAFLVAGEYMQTAQERLMAVFGSSRGLP